MTLLSSQSWIKYVVAICAVFAMAVSAGSSAFASDVPWYKRLFRRDGGGETVASPAIQSPAMPTKATVAPAPSTESLRAPIRSYKQDPAELVVDDALPVFGESDQTLSDETRFDLSEEMSPADRHLKREFPMPAPRIPQAPYTAPTPNQYRVPSAAPSAAPQPPRSLESDR